jgi:hypothetical protein
METQKPTGKATNSQTKKPFYKKWWFIMIAVIVVLSAIFGSSDDKKNAKKKDDQPVAEVKQEENQNVATETKAEVAESQPAQEAIQEIKTPDFEIVYELKNQRYDGGADYYVLIKPVNLANDNFKNDIMAITKKMVKEKGSKISIEFFDSKEALDFHYQKWVKMTVSRPETQKEKDLLALHYIAGFSGELKTDPDFNSLSFFLATFTDNPKVGKYVGNMKFNPAE